MITIHLNQLQFFAHHGLHDEENIIGTNYEVSASVYFIETEKIIHLHQTIDYTAVYNIIKKHMLHPRPLLESLATEIADEIYSLDKRIKTINIDIYKLHPPIENFTGRVGVTFSKEFSSSK